MDDDTFVSVNNLIRLVRTLQAEEERVDYFGFCGIYPGVDMWMCGGSGYGLSKRAISLVRDENCLSNITAE